MKRAWWVALCSVALTAGAAQAQNAASASHASGSLGFHHIEAPVGLRWWLSSQKVGLDFGLGFSSTPAAVDPDERETGLAFDFGVPLVLKSWDGVHLLFRPGLLYESQEVGFDGDPVTPGLQFETETTSRTSILAELEVEAFLRDHFSVSASHGLGFVSEDPGFGGDTQTSFGTFGNQFTNIGFHLYCFGGGQ